MDTPELPPQNTTPAPQTSESEMDEFETSANKKKKDNSIHRSKKLIIIIGAVIFASLIAIASAITLFQNNNRPTASVPPSNVSLSPSATVAPSTSVESSELDSFRDRADKIQNKLNNTPEERAQLNAPNLDFSTTLK